MARVYSFWIFDRYCNAIYHQDWSHLHASSSSSAPKGPLSPTIAQTSSFASLGASIQRATTGTPNLASSSAPLPARRPGEPSLPGVTRISPVTQREMSNSLSARLPADPSSASVPTKSVVNASSNGLLPFDEEAKLVYGVVFSLRNMVRKLGGE
uniref:Trafficking protein particle complex subunit n=1 Tax=Melanopsichium pennsylvanicum 4 TaxID=1398559 RepID=A0A077R203_9BASI|nr:conserved hypothetical protein [Melanopsichium pennsylvanicum 4]